MYRFLLRPMWLLSHLFVLAVLVAFVNLGLWQLRRLDERRELNAAVTEKLDAAPVAIDELVAPTSSAGEAEAAEFRQVTASGTYVPDEQVLVANRTLDGVPGYWVVTPLDLGDGVGVAVNRGWVRFDVTDLDGAGREYPPPEGRVTVSGVAQPSQQREGIGAAEGEGRQSTLTRLDVGRLDEQSALALLPLYVDLASADPPVVEPPRPLPPPDLSEGPHLNYAGQWFLFTAIVAVGYPLALRRIAHQRAGSGDAGADIAASAPDDGTSGEGALGADAEDAPLHAGSP